MKKLLVLALVLSVASLANAALVVSAPGYNGEMLNPSDTVVLAIGTDAVISPGVGEGFWALGASMAGATVSGGVSLYPTEGGIAIFDDAVTAGIQLPAGDNGVFGMIGLGTLPNVQPGGIYDGIVFHCEGPGDVTVTLYMVSGDTGEILSTLNSVVVHQIPEPFTMGLLGLGGLFLRRRSK
jgi:hypothetical protein